LANIKNDENVVIKNHINGSIISTELIVVTNKGIYKIVKIILQKKAEYCVDL